LAAPRTYLTALLATISLFGFCSTLGADNSQETVQIGAGSLIPMYGAGKIPTQLEVKTFRIDAHPVTNKKFFEFISDNPNWAKDKAARLLVDEKYLSHWQLTTKGFEPNKTALQSPVTNVSWFAANEYCKTRNGRLPTVLEWEYVGAASETKKDASHDPDFVAKLLEWYAQPNGSGQLAPVGQHKPNYWGVYDMHGLIWEWTSDFNGIFVSGDNRREGEDLKNAFCGNSAVSATDKANYAAFMRYAMRNSLKPRYATNSLGFRCAYDS
jgi:sulfatase modifying factor 1